MHEAYDPATALLVVDVQNDFADPAGGLAVAGGEEILPVLNDEIAAARAAGAFVAYTQDWHPPTTPHFAKDGGMWPVHCVGGTWGAELHPALIADAGPSVRKGTNGEDGYSGFTMRDPLTGATVPTELDGLLRGRRDPTGRDRRASPPTTASRPPPSTRSPSATRRTSSSTACAPSS